ncbi:MFS transporter [Arthrobacter sp. ISL-5]|uniref:MFS transporter n=1 Tax=Arthrobacter sp. ISL-5 TaxID=2819111 RepID=UPI001BEC302E|nr:MFS transporter [Arthrobacter sp. ISL-5]MBT2556013.1 MFS transporter [Arthrobacter sp. ISL-5]
MLARTDAMPDDTLHAIATKKAFRHLLPLLMAVFFIAFVDRTNVSLAKHSLEISAGIDAAAYGLGAGLFFVTYALLEIPSNLVLYRVGPRIWISRIAITWGIISSAMLMVDSPAVFYILRMLLGAAEAGIYPALMYVVATWFAHSDRSRAVSLVALAAAIGGVVANPLGGAIIAGTAEWPWLDGWQWMFLLEGIPAVLIGLVIFFRLPNSPADARWLSGDEAAVLAERAVGEVEPQPTVRRTLAAIVSTPFILALAAIYFLSQVANFGIIFFTPAIVAGMIGPNIQIIGLITGLVGLGGVTGLLVTPSILKRLGEILTVAIYSSAVLIFSLLFGIVDNNIFKLVTLALIGTFVIGSVPVYWPIIMKRLTGRTAAAGFAFLNTVGLAGGFVGPYFFGLSEVVTGSAASGVSVVVLAALGMALLTPLLYFGVRKFDRSRAGEYEEAGFGK